VLTLGFRFWSGEHFGRPPTWNDKAKYSPGRSTPRVSDASPAEIPMVGDPKLVLRQMINRINGAEARFHQNRSSTWVKELSEVRAQLR